MAIPVTLSVGPITTASANAIALSQIPVSATAITLNGALASGGVATLDVGRRVRVTFGNEVTARTVRITGTNASGNPIRETVAISSGGAGTVDTTSDFKTVTEAMPLGGGFSAAVTIGTNGVASSPWQPTNIYADLADYSWGIVVSGTVNVGIQISYTDPNFPSAYVMGSQSIGNYPNNPTAYDHVTLNALTANADGSLSAPFYSWRIILNSGTGSATVTCIQAGGSSW